MLTIRVVTGPETAAGFRLAGIEVDVVLSPEEASKRLHRRLADESCGLLIVDEKIMEQMEEPLRRRLERAGLPIVVPVPVDMTWGEEERSMDYLLRLIRRSIGFHMRIRK